MGDRVCRSSEGLGTGETMRSSPGLAKEKVSLDKREVCTQLVELLDRIATVDFCEALIAAMLIHGQHVRIKVTPVNR